MSYRDSSQRNEAKRFQYYVCKMPIRVYYKHKDRNFFLTAAICGAKSSKVDKETAC